jgi:hypothetical protein
MPSGWLSARGRVLAGVGVGVLSWVLSPALVDEAVGDGLAWEMRLRALPSRLGVYFVLGLCLYSGEPYQEVLRLLAGGLERRLAAAGWRVPVSRALTGVRRRVGERPLESLFRKVAGAVSPGTAAWSHLGGLLVVAWDGTCVLVAGSAANAAEFGAPQGGSRKGVAAAGGRVGAYPQARVVALVACGTRAVIGAACGPARGKGTGERALAAQLLGSLRAGMLLLADRGFYSWQLWSQCAATGAHLLWRVADAGDNCLRLPVLEQLDDGSWLSRVWERAERKDNGKPRKGQDRGRCLTVRVIEFTVTVAGDDGTARTSRYRLLTTLLDHRAFPAAALAACYARRWSAELAYRELKAVLRGPGRVLRGRTPDLARQEIWAYLAIYQATRILIARAAARDGLDPARISASAALRAARRTIQSARASMTTALDQAEAEILDPAALVPLRPGRVWPRVAKHRTTTWPPPHRATTTPDNHATYRTTITSPQPRHQQKQPANQARIPP